MRRETISQSLCQVERVDQRAELVARQTRLQTASELERVDDLGALPIAELALQHPNVHVCVVGHQNQPGQRPANFVLDICEHWSVGNIIVGDAVYPTRERRDRLIGSNKPTPRLTDDAIDDRHHRQLHEVWRMMAVKPSTSTTAYCNEVQSVIRRVSLPADVRTAMNAGCGVDGERRGPGSRARVAGSSAVAPRPDQPPRPPVR
jgi:hypothetical protein